MPAKELSQQPVLSISELIASNSTKNMDELSTNAQMLFGLITLIVGIQYRVMHGDTFDGQAEKRYSEGVMKRVVADRITPVDDGLLR